jgi:hypothetical protein
MSDGRSEGWTDGGTNGKMDRWKDEAAEARVLLTSRFI